MPYCIYLRKSRADIEAENRGEGETLARHRAALLDVARRQSLSVTEIYSEIVSGDTISSRPVMQKLLSHIEQGLWEGILVMDIDRLARGDTIDQGIVSQALKFSNTKIVTPSKTYDPNNEYDEEYFEFGLFMARREYKIITRRMQRGREASIREGKYVGNKPPYGYRRKKIEGAKGFTLEPDPIQADAVKLIFEWYTTGVISFDNSRERLGFSKIAQRLDELHFPTISGKAWSAATIKEILTNPTYIGKVRWNRRPAIKQISDGVVSVHRPRADPDHSLLVDGIHSPIIDEETFHAAQKYFQMRLDSQTPKGKSLKNPIAKLVVCGMCGRVMVRRPYSKRDYPDTLLCPNRCCNNVSALLHTVEERMISLLEQWLISYKIQIEKEDLENKEFDIKKQTIAQIEDRLKKLKLQQNKLYDLLEQGIYSTDVFLERSQQLAENIASANAELEKLYGEVQNYETLLLRRQEFIPKVEKILALYRLSKDPKEKNDLLKQVVDKAVYKKTANGHYKGQRADDFDLTIFPKLPTP